MRFKDETGADWDLSLNIGIARKLRDAYEFDVFSLNEGVILSALQDPLALAEIIREICRSQIEQRDLTELEFYERLTAGVIERAGDAFLNAVANFTPSMQRKAAEILVDKTKEKAAKVAEEMAETVKRLDLDGISSTS